MVTIGTQGTCKFCGCQTMEDEIRYSECRAECPECGLYYESGFVSRILPYYLPEPEQHPFLATLYHAFQADGWHITDTRCFRIGVIHRPLSPAHCFYILNSWFTVPTPLIAPKLPYVASYPTTESSCYPLTVRWFVFDAMEAARFNVNDWYIED